MPPQPGGGAANPAVSVVMSVYNGERFLEEAVASVLEQDLREVELIVVDDGSTDRTPAILGALARADGRVVVRSQRNQGRTAALNVGFALARGPLVARLDDDDVATPARLARQRAFLEENDHVALVGGAATFVDEHGTAIAEVRYPTSDAEIRRALGRTSPFVHSAVMLRRSAFREVGGYRPIFPMAEDLDLWLRIAERHQVANLPETVVRYRVHGGQASVRHLELEVVCSLAAREAARARAGGAPDPVESMEVIDRDALIRLGVSPEEIATAFVRSATWLARSRSRAGLPRIAEELFAAAEVEARRSPSSSRALLAYVHRARAQRHDEEGRWLRARGEMARALLVGRSIRRLDRD
jgi:hypothetical protein